MLLSWQNKSQFPVSPVGRTAAGRRRHQNEETVFCSFRVVFGFHGNGDSEAASRARSIPHAANSGDVVKNGIPRPYACRPPPPRQSNSYETSLSKKACESRNGSMRK
ncbi:hypothetical protein TGRUB_304755 [Toxoplasma gondii RUB]|uniref:Uncharacterized protein n=1 Tax=Toxoplasma gondii RUB TaxID=935652 RepID=A0A086LQW7_TOXGO|nr:hypothetical protein TGRUB_304755 [Toxoplasma gondii RUB]